MHSQNRIDFPVDNDNIPKTKKSSNAPPFFTQNLKKDVENTLDIKKLSKDSRLYRVIGVLLLAFSVYLFFAILSYFYTWKHDQSEIDRGFWVSLFTAHNVHNKMGVFGAYLSHWFVFKGFGVFSIVLCSTIAIIGSNLFFQTIRFSLWRNLRYVFFILVFGSSFLSFFNSNSSFSWGGEIGYMIAEGLRRYLGSVGTFLFLLAGLIALATWVLGLKWKLPKWRHRIKQLQVFLFGEMFTRKNVSENNTKKTVPENSEPASNTIDFSSITTEEPFTINKAIESELFIEEQKETDQLDMQVIDTTTDEKNFHVDDFTEEADNTEAKQKSVKPYDPTLELSNYKYPETPLLTQHGSNKIEQNKEELEKNKNQIVSTLKNYDIGIEKIFATIGPTVTLYEIVPAAGVRISKIKNLEDDIALSLSALGIRIIAPIPGKGTIGIEVPNQNRSMVSMRSILESEPFQKTSMLLPIALGKTIDNTFFILDLATMPHLLMAGATGQGKSVGINAILISLIYKLHPSEIKFILVDPKKVELSIYNTIEKHFLAKLPGEEEAIITDTKKVIYSLNALCIEMDNRYDLLKEAGVRNLREYNAKFLQRKLNPQKGHQFLPFIVLVIDEFADMIMTAGKEVETPIGRLAQLARAVGIHLVIATQRPSVNIITGTIKANFPSRIAFKVSSKIDSRTILDAGGADQLIGKGDMLVSHNGHITRVQCAFVDTDEVENVVQFIGKQQGFPNAFYLPEYVDEKNAANGDTLADDEKDILLEEAARLIVINQSGSTSLIQRKMKLGYNRAGRIMDQLEMLGIVGPAQGSKPREVLITDEEQLNTMF